MLPSNATFRITTFRYVSMLDTWENAIRAGSANFVGFLKSIPVNEIERFEVVVLAPTGGDVGGFWLLRGTEEQIDSVRRSEEYVALIQRVQLVVTGLRIADAFLDEGLVRVMGSYQKLVDEMA